MRRTPGFALLVLALATVAAAQTSSTRLIPFSGTALDGAGTPLTRAVTLVFELYEEQQDGAPLWRETQRVQPDERGRYLAYLGAVTPIPQIAFTEERARWLAVMVEGRAFPRVMLVAVPYALRAADADTLGGQPASSFVRTGVDEKPGTNARVVVSAAVIDGSGNTNSLAKFNSPTTISSAAIAEVGGRVGFGLADPTGGGVVDSVFTIRNFDNNTGFGILNQNQQRRFAINTSTNGSWILYDGAGGTWNAGLSQIAGRISLGDTFNTGTLAVASASPGEVAVLGESTVGSGVVGLSSAGLGVGGGSVTSIGVSGSSQTNTGVLGNSVSGVGVMGTSSGGLAGQFTGDVEVSGNLAVGGTLSKGGGSFTIDHPLDPTNKVLQHSFVESPDMMNVYNGNVTLDESGGAWVTLPEWFEALNRDFRYQLTAMGAPGPNLYVASEVSGNRFKIAGGTPSGRVSWQVTGIRQDAWANAHRIVVEQVKPEAQRGSYLHPGEHVLGPNKQQ